LLKKQSFVKPIKRTTNLVVIIGSFGILSRVFGSRSLNNYYFVTSGIREIHIQETHISIDFMKDFEKLTAGWVWISGMNLNYLFHRLLLQSLPKRWKFDTILLTITMIPWGKKPFLWLAMWDIIFIPNFSFAWAASRNQNENFSE
jgi:hypothetical protein